VCVVISDLTGELQCDLVVTLSDLPNSGITGMLPTAIPMHNCNLYRLICILFSVEGQDYTVTPAGVYEATFPSTTTMNGDVACDTITIVDDDVLEGPHDFRFQILRTSLPGIITMGEILTAVNIEDNDSKY